MIATMTLTEFLLARIAEDERLLQAPEFDNPKNDMRVQWAEVGAISEVLLIGEARLRAECEAKRRIVQHCEDRIAIESDVQPDDGAAFLARDVLWSLAFPYSTHPDFDETWRP